MSVHLVDSPTLAPRLPQRLDRPAPPADPAAALAMAAGTLAMACERRRGDMVGRIALASGCRDAVDRRQASLWDELAFFVPDEFTAAREDRMWTVRSLSGLMIDLVRLDHSGAVQSQDAPRSSVLHWTLDNGDLVVNELVPGARTRILLTGRSRGHRMMIGFCTATREVLVLSEVDCLYSSLRLLDPLLASPMAGIVRPSDMVDPALPEIPVVVLAAARTGSHLLLNLLNSTDRVFIDAEILNAQKISVFGADLPSDRADGLDMLRGCDHVRFAKAMMTRSHHVDGRRLDGIRVRGFKLFPQQSRAVLDWAFDTPEVRLVHLYRANLLAEFSSYLAAQRDKCWVGGAQPEDRRPVAFDRARFERFVDMKARYLDEVRRRLGERAGPSIEVEYSRIDRPCVNEVLSFLTGATSDAPFDALGLKRQLAGRVIDRFANPEDVAASLEALGHPEWAGVESAEVGRL